MEQQALPLPVTTPRQRKSPFSSILRYLSNEPCEEVKNDPDWPGNHGYTSKLRRDNPSYLNFAAWMQLDPGFRVARNFKEDRTVQIMYQQSVVDKCRQAVDGVMVERQKQGDFYLTSFESYDEALNEALKVSMNKWMEESEKLGKLMSRDYKLNQLPSPSRTDYNSVLNRLYYSKDICREEDGIYSQRDEVVALEGDKGETLLEASIKIVIRAIPAVQPFFSHSHASSKTDPHTQLFSHERIRAFSRYTALVINVVILTVPLFVFGGFHYDSLHWGPACLVALYAVVVVSCFGCHKPYNLVQFMSFVTALVALNFP